jgi:hypothetical protein
MSPGLWVLVAALVVLVLLVGWWLSWTARRLDRLHHRLDLAHGSLVGQLQLRAALALEVGTAGLLDPASSLLLIDAAAAARGDLERPDTEAQSHLSQTLRLVLPEDRETREALRTVYADPAARELLDQLAAASRKVELARRFHNDQVRATRDLRSRRRTQWFRLAGKAPQPRPIDFDDHPPAVFSVETAAGLGPAGPTVDPVTPDRPAVGSPSPEDDS